VGKKTRQTDKAHLDELRELVAGGEGNGALPKTSDRRSILKMAGAAVLGAAGMAAVKVIPAAAATGGPVLLGCNNSANAPTQVSNSTSGALQSAISGQAPSIGILGSGTAGSSEIGVWGKSSTGTGIGVQGTSNPTLGGTGGTGIGVFGQSATGIGVDGAATGAGTGVVGTAGAGGIGVNGAGSTGYGGLFTSTTGYDLALGYPVANGAVGSGRLGMIGRFDLGTVAPNIAPTFTVTSTGGPIFEHELIRGQDSSIWASRKATTGTNQSRWKRINAVRVDSADGTGAPYAPLRVFDSRIGGGAKKAVGSTTVVPVAGQGTSTSAIPADAIAVMGNLTATGYTAAGFLALSPSGVAVTTSSVNFITGQPAIANGFIMGLAGGAVQVKVAGSATHFIIDITGYIQ
jgi:hypothetical protein